MNDHLPKPFRESELVAVLRRWLPAIAVDEADAPYVADRTTTPKLPYGPLADAFETGGPGRARELVELFLEGLTGTQDEIRVASRAGRVEEIVDAAQRLRGSAASVGEPRLAELLASIESMAATVRPAGQPASGLLDIVADIDREIEAVAARMTQLRAELDAGPRVGEP